MKIEKWLSINSKEDFNNKTVFISGGHSGIGLELSKILNEKGCNVIWGARNKKRAESSLNEIKIPAKVKIFDLDLASFESIRNFVNELKINNITLDYVINNAGVYHLDKGYTKEGLDLIIGTNVIGPYYLNLLLIDLYKNSGTRFIFTTSIAVRYSHMDYDDFLMEKHYKKNAAYANSKLEIIHAYLYLKDKYKDENISFALTHPGAAYTPLIYKGYKSKFIHVAGKIFMDLFFHSPKMASLSMLKAMEKENANTYWIPKDLFGFKGYPIKKNIPNKYKKNYLKTIEKIEEILKEKINNQ